MILPDKYISIENSYVGLSAFIIDLIKENEHTIENLWKTFKKNIMEATSPKLRLCLLFKNFYPY